MKLIKTRLSSRLGEDTLNHIMRISKEGPDKLNSEDLDSITQYWKEKKNSKTNDWASEASPTLGCSIEISRDWRASEASETLSGLFN